MNFLDILLLGMVGASVIAGFMSGFTRTAFGMIAAVAGILLGFWFYDVPAGWYVGTLGSEMAANLFGFLTVFLIAIVAGAVVGRIVSTAFKMVGLGPLDRLAGAAFGFVRGLCVAAAATSVLLVAVPKPVPDFVRESAILPYALGAADFASALAPAALKKAVSNSIGEVKKSWNEEVDKAKRRAEKAFDAEPAAKQEVEIVPPKAKAKKKLTAPPKAVKQ